MPHVIAVLALRGLIPFDLAIPCEIFGRVPGYDLRVCGPARRVPGPHFDIAVRHGLAALAEGDTVIVPGISDVQAPTPPAVLDALRAAARRGTRIASICSGAFVLAQAGLLDGRRATTHWLAAPLLARRFPAVSVDADVLFVDEGDILTSAGAAAGMDLCLHMLRRDRGAAVAAEAARLAVMPPQREGGQAQFIRHDPPAEPSPLDPLLDWLRRNLQRPLTLDQIAGRAGMSVRTLTRRFRDRTGTTPLQWLLAARVRRAQHLLETTGLGIEQVATRCGFESAAAFRDRFGRVAGTSPSAYRRGFNAWRPGTPRNSGRPASARPG